MDFRLYTAIRERESMHEIDDFICFDVHRFFVSHDKRHITTILNFWYDAYFQTHRFPQLFHEKVC